MTLNDIRNKVFRNSSMCDRYLYGHLKTFFIMGLRKNKFFVKALMKFKLQIIEFFWLYLQCKRPKYSPLRTKIRLNDLLRIYCLMEDAEPSNVLLYQ